MADKPVAVLTARVQIDKQDSFKRFEKDFKDFQKTVNKNEVVYKITADKDSLIKVLKEIANSEFTIGADVVLNSKAKDIQAQIKELLNSVSSEVKGIDLGIGDKIKKELADVNKEITKQEKRLTELNKKKNKENKPTKSSEEIFKSIEASHKKLNETDLSNTAYEKEVKHLRDLAAAYKEVTKQTATTKAQFSKIDAWLKEDASIETTYKGKYNNILGNIETIDQKQIDEIENTLKDLRKKREELQNKLNEIINQEKDKDSTAKSKSKKDNNKKEGTGLETNSEETGDINRNVNLDATEALETIDKIKTGLDDIERARKLNILNLDEVENVVDAIVEKLNSMGYNLSPMQTDNLYDVVKAMMEADKIMSSSKIRQNERAFLYNKEKGTFTNPFIYGNEYGVSKELNDNIKKSGAGGNFRGDFHSHTLKTAVMSLADLTTIVDENGKKVKDYQGDLLSYATRMRDIDEAIIAAQNGVQVFNAKAFFKDYDKIGFQYRNKINEIGEILYNTQQKIFQEYLSKSIENGELKINWEEVFLSGIPKTESLYKQVSKKLNVKELNSKFAKHLFENVDPTDTLGSFENSLKVFVNQELESINEDIPGNLASNIMKQIREYYIKLSKEFYKSTDLDKSDVVQQILHKIQPEVMKRALGVDNWQDYVEDLDWDQFKERYGKLGKELENEAQKNKGVEIPVSPLFNPEEFISEISKKLEGYFVEVGILPVTGDEAEIQRRISLIADAFKKALGAAEEGGASLVDAAEESTAKEQKSESPSKVAEALGEYWGQGYAKGILEHKDDVEKAVAELVKTGRLTVQTLMTDLAFNIKGKDEYKDLLIPVQNVINKNKIYHKAEDLKDLREQYKLLRMINKDIQGRKNNETPLLNASLEELEKDKREILSLNSALESVADSVEYISKSDFLKRFGNAFPEQIQQVLDSISTGVKNVKKETDKAVKISVKDFVDLTKKINATNTTVEELEVLISKFQQLAPNQNSSKEMASYYEAYKKLTAVAKELGYEYDKTSNKLVKIGEATSKVNTETSHYEKVLSQSTQVTEEQGSVARQQTNALKAEEQQAEATAQAEKKVAEARQEAFTPTTSTASGGSTSDTTTSSIQILTEEELQKELAKVRETIDKEKVIIKELEDELSQEVPKAIQRKNEEFDREVEKVREVVDKEKVILGELKEYLDTTIPEAIDVKNSKFNEEVGKVKQAIDEEIRHLDRFRSELEKPISIDIQKDNEDTFDDSYAFSEAMDRFAKKQQAQHQRKLDNLTALTSQLKAKNDARDEEKELQGVKDLDNALEEVIKKINLKITAFSHEEDRVKDISRNEAIALQEIINKLETIKTLATDMKSAFQGIKVDGKIDIKGIKDILQFEGKDFTTVANSLKSLFDALNELKLGDKSFIKQLDSILAKGKELDNLVKVLKTSEKKITQAKENVKTDKEKNREDSYKKELELEKQKLALEKEYQLLEAKGDSKAEETKAKNLIKINQLEKERKQIVDSRKKGETSKDLRNQINSEIKAIRERNEADIQAEKAAKEVHDQKQRRADKEKAWNTAEKKFNDEKAKAAKEAAEAEAKATKEAEKAKIEAEKKASQEAKNAERIRKESLEESYGMQKALMKEASDLAIRNLALSDSESEFDIKEVANNNERIAEIGKQINDIVEKRNKLDSDSITLHRELLNYQEELNRDYQTQFDLRDRNKATEHNENAIAAYKELIKTANEYYNLQINTLGKDDNNPDVIRLKELIDKWEEARKAKEEYNDFSVNKEGSNKSIQGLKEIEEQFANVEAQVSAKIRESLVKELPKYIKLDKENKYIDEFSDKVKEVLTLIKDIDNKGLDLSNPEDVQRVHQIREDIAFINSEKGLSKYKAASETRIKQLQLQIRQFQNNNSAMGKTFSEQFDNLFDQFSAAKSIAEVDELKGKFASLEAEVVKAGKTGKSFFKTFVEHLKSTNAQLLATYFSFQDFIRYGRTAFETVRQLDTALVDLKKTTTMNNTDLEEFYQNSNDIAKQMGVTTQEIIDQASQWSRLGFSTKEQSESLAQLSSKFASISPGMTSEQAQSGMVSIMKAWDISTDQVEREVLDNINILGNRFAETNLDIVEGMQRSAAAMAAVGEDWRNAFALFTGGKQLYLNVQKCA